MKRALVSSLRWNHHRHESMHRSRSIGFPAVYRALFSNTTSSNSVSSYIVIGNGPIGSSVAKHLVRSLVGNNAGRSQQTITIIDGRPSGMGSSHSDRARLIRTFDAEGNVDWTRWAVQLKRSHLCIRSCARIMHNAT